MSNPENTDASLGALRVLLVEDHPFQRAAAGELLRRMGIHSLRFAGNGREAAEELAATAFDVVICDIEMPLGNGPELMAELIRRGDGAFREHAPVWIWLTALADDILDSHRNLTRDAGIPYVHALRKPLRPEPLRAILCDALVQHPVGEGERRNAAAGCSLPDDETLLDAVQSRTGFFTVLQPQFDIATGRLSGAEALCRWQHPTLGMIRPDLFIARLEELDAVDPLFLMAVEQCLAVQRRLLPAGLAVPLGVNASARTLCRTGLLEQLEALVGNSQVPRHLITIELTEGFAPPSAAALSVALNRLRLLGYGVAIDDFGIGIATLKLLADLPFTEIKLDRSVVADVAGHGQREIICRHVVHMANELGLGCVAEGVETERQRAALNLLQCRTGQGYLWSPPMPVDSFVDKALSSEWPVSRFGPST